MLTGTARLCRKHPNPFNHPPDIDPRRLALVATATRNMVLILDGSGRIEWVNQAFEQDTGHTLEGVRGH